MTKPILKRRRFSTSDSSFLNSEEIKNEFSQGNKHSANVIAICLFLMVGRQLSGLLVPAANAGPPGMVPIIGCYRASDSANCVLVPIRVDNVGRLLTSQ